MILDGVIRLGGIRNDSRGDENAWDEHKRMIE